MSTPSKKILLLCFISLFFFGTIVYIFFHFGRKETYVSDTTATSTAESAILAKDSDNDGLKDWEEQLWKTDLQNPDSDADGTVDGAEIKLGRNPLVAGPNDKLDSTTVAEKINTETDADLSDTEKFSRELFLKIIAAEQSQNPSQADFQNFLDATMANEVAAQKATLYTAGDFRVDTEETPETIKAYGNAIATILKTPPPQKLEYEIDIVNRAEANKDPSELKKLNANITAHKIVESALLKLTVPKSAVQVHLALINGASGMAWSLTGLSYILTDPLKALPGVARYPQNFQDFFSAIHSLRDYLKNTNTVFDPTDAGYHTFDAL